MTDSNLVQTKLHNQLQAADSEVIIEDSRYLYHLTFSENIGWDWCNTQIDKASAKLDVDLEPWKIAGGNEFAVIVREVDRRPSIDNNQGDLFDYE